MDIEADELARLWRENKHRPAFVREYADAINEHTDLERGVPQSDDLATVAHWLNDHKAVVTRQLPDPDAEADDTTDAEDNEVVA